MCRRGAAGLVPSPAAPESWGAVAGRQEEQEASEQLSRLGLTLHFPHDALGPPLAGVKAHPPWGGPGEGGVSRVPPLSAPGAVYLRVSTSFRHSGLWKHRSQLLGSGPQRSPESRNPQAVLSAQKQPALSLLKFEPSAACTCPWGWPTPSLTLTLLALDLFSVLFSP